jgi:hypothetical protein
MKEANGVSRVLTGADRKPRIRLHLLATKTKLTTNVAPFSHDVPTFPFAKLPRVTGAVESSVTGDGISVTFRYRYRYRYGLSLIDRTFKNRQIASFGSLRSASDADLAAMASAPPPTSTTTASASNVAATATSATSSVSMD